jgi:uncharacterized protein
VIIADTGFFVAINNANDADHVLATRTLEGLEEGLVTTWPVMAETTHLLANRVGVDAMLAFMASARAGAFSLFELGTAHLTRIEALMRRYRNLPMDLADASLVLVAEEQGDGRILSTDRRDFRAYRWKNRKPFVNLLERS